MAKVILICGKICSGKTSYAAKLCNKNNAVLLSVDEIMLTLFGPDAGESHDLLSGRVQKYLLDKSLELLSTGTNVVLDWGFWRRKQRSYTRNFYITHGFECEFHYIDISDIDWHANIEERNNAVKAGKIQAYYVDEGLLSKLKSFFEIPDKSEIDVWYKFSRK